MSGTTFATMRKVLATALVFISAAAVIVAMALFDGVAYAASERYDVTSTKRSISAGVTETLYYTNVSSNDDQVVTYAVDIDLSQNSLIAGYKDYNSKGEWGMQTVREQAAAAESARGLKVVAAVNADFYNMGTGEPTGSLVMEGNVVKNASGNYFAILKDGTAVIRTGALRGDEQEVVGGSTIMIENGQIAAMSGDYDTTKYPRTAVGIKADGNVLIMVADGRQAPYSTGYTLAELAQKMLDLGCVSAMNLDGGGSTTYLAKYAGSDELELANSPSDGQERSVSSTLLVVSYAEPTHEFGSAVISPDNEVYTPGSTVEFTAIGADTAGYSVEIPDGVTWRLASEDAGMGEIVETESEEGKSSAIFTAAEGVVGNVTAELVYNGEVVGSASVELQWPDELTMTNSVFSLDFSERTDFGLTAHWNAREVHFKTGDIVWNIGGTGDEKYPSIGAMDGDVFVADAEATNVSAKVTASLAHNSAVSVSAQVSVGQLPTVVWDFEDRYDENGELLYTAEEYYSTADTGRFIVSTVSNARGSAQIVDAKAGEVRVGQKALQLNYDFTQATPTAGVYFGPRESVAIPGHPTGLGVWIYVPAGMANFWLRGYFSGTMEDGSQAPGNAWGNNYVVDFTESTAGSMEEGWHYIEADFSSFSTPAYTYYLGTQTFRIMYTTTTGAATTGFIYLDNFQFVYGANTDDLNAPEINNIKLNGINGEEISDGTVISEDPFSLYVSYNEFEETYATGINTEDVHVYIDGNEVELADATEIELWTRDISLPAGKHRITVEINDNFQNAATKTVVVNVENDKEYASVYLQGSDDAPYLGADYILQLFAQQPEKVDIVSFELRLAAGLTLSYGEVAEGFAVTECELVHVNNNIFRVTVERISSGEAVTYAGETVLCELKVHCPTTLTEGSVLTYYVESSEVIYSDGFQNTILNSFYTESYNVPIESYYTITADIMVVGSAGGYIYVTDPDGNRAAGVHVTIDGAEVGVTDEEGKLFTTSFVGAACTKVVAAYSDMGYSFGRYINGVLAGGATDESGASSPAPVFVRSVATVNGNTEQRIVWMVNPLAVGALDRAYVKYATAADYENTGEAAFRTVIGQTALVEFNDGYAVRINTMLLEKLTPGTAYVYIVGDGANWSELKTFSTTSVNGETNFIVMGDTQADNPDVFSAYNQAISSSGINYDFAIQTGDFVDDGGEYTLWSNILSLFSQYFGDTDFVQVFGNHEYEGNEDGHFPETVNFTPGEKYYSVTYGNVYVAVINCYLVEDMEEAAAWIKADAAKSDAVWKVLTLHRPPYYTNTIGGSENSHNIVPALADEAGFDVVFSGHDHSFARTKPMKGGEVNENGTVYYIVGAAEQGGKYSITDNPEFNFAKVSGDFNALYFSVSASYTQMKLTVYNLTDDGSFEVFDEYTITNECYPDNHDFVFNTASGMLVCERCHYEISPEEGNFSGLVMDTEGRNMFFTQGEMLVNEWLPYGGDYYYFGADGRGAEGSVVLQTDYAGNSCGEISFVFENGKKIGGETRWYGEKYYIDGTFATGFVQIDGKLYYLWTSADNNWYGYEYGDRVTGYKQIALQMGGWQNDTYFWFDETDGHMLGQAVDEDGNVVPGKFYQRTSQWSYLTVSEKDGTFIGDYYLIGWLTANDLAGNASGNRYYMRWDSLYTGTLSIDGVKYEFSTKGNNPLTDGTGALLGRYYTVRFNQYDGTYTEQEVFEGGYVIPPEEHAVIGNSIKYYEFLGWYVNGEPFNFETTQINSDIRATATFKRTYQQIYGDTIWANDKLEQANASGSFQDKKSAIKTMAYIYNNLTKEQIADMKAEKSDIFDLYEEMSSKLYTITFVSEGQTMSTATLYEGETISAPSTPAKSGNSIKSYKFIGWFSGEDKYENGAIASADTVYTAKFETVYTDTYNNVNELLNALSLAVSPAEKREALNAMDAAYVALNATQLADMKTEGLSFALYKEMLGKLYTITFSSDGQTLGSATLYEGETIVAPESPAKQGNSIKSYAFVGWFSGETMFEDGVVAAANAAYVAKFNTEYTQEYAAMETALNALAATSEGTLEQKYTALTAIYDLLKTFSAQQKADAEAEGLSFAQYEGMLAEYNAIAEGAAEDAEKAADFADKIVNAAAAVSLFAAAAYVTSKEVIL